eukprot:CAMPEP_0201686336 /NCGR_PEP_ID=MMETSP0578-20130828/824_1 /ASSEMBLY_ACC=CAM_ASM_000663 /TAXON_ID=267565 /ORGANISM="Skeletonema grethea, Strain CCMP 1804" /LENGTH=148 /DNA_ID=CAMNT_0048170383 /DNA_START=11 /DNA_END=457 /DNA_ORIENTATION=-
MKCLNTTLLLLSAVAALGRESNNELERSKPIVTLEIERQLGESSLSSKSSKSGYIFAKTSKSHTSAKSSKSSHLSVPLESQEVSSNSRDSRDIELVEEIEFRAEEIGRAEEIEEVVTSQTQYSINGGIVKDYTTAACIGIITTALLLN